MKGLKKRKAYVGVNLIFVFIFITVLFIEVLSFQKDTAKYVNSNIELVKGDYKAEQALEITKINFYRAIENSYNKTKNERDFLEDLYQVEFGMFKEVKKMKYFDPANTRVNLWDEKDNAKISKDKRFIDYAITIVYRDKGYFREYRRQARVSNPYRYFEIDENNKKELKSRDFKKLFNFHIEEGL